MELNNPKYLTEIQVATMTGLAVSTLRNQRFQCKGIPYIKLGRSVRYSLQDVIEYVEKRKVSTEDHCS